MFFTTFFHIVFLNITFIGVVQKTLSSFGAVSIIPNNSVCSGMAVNDEFPEISTVKTRTPNQLFVGVSIF